MNSKRSRSSGFHDDASMEILLRLPIKSVIRFQIVSKNWLSLISSDHFRREHTLRHHKLPPCFIYTTKEKTLCYFNPMTKSTMIIPLSLDIPGNCVRILSCCNGLVLLSRCPDLHVYNPMTRQSRKIILPRNETYIYLISTLHLVSDPSKSPHYKIIYIRGEKKGRSLTYTYTIEVFSSESGSWKACMEPITSEFWFTTSVYCNNKIYGLNRYSDGYLYCFDIDKNVLTFLATPPTAVGRYYNNYHSIQEWNGYLYYTSIYRGNDSGRHSACLWEKDKDDDKWSLKYNDRIPLPGRFKAPEFRLIAQTSTLLIIGPSIKIMAYSFLDKSYSQLLDTCMLQIPWDYGSMHLFHQTLAPV